MHAGQPMAAVQEEERLAAAEAGVAGPSAADQKASIRDALSPSSSPEDTLVAVSLKTIPHCETHTTMMASWTVETSGILSQLLHST